MIKLIVTMFVLTLMLLSFLLSLSHAQDTVNVDIGKSKFVWEWDQGTGDMADFFKMKCSSVPSGAVFTSDTIGLLKEMPVSEVISIRGTYDCHVVAVNVAGESDPSNVVGLKIVGKPVRPTNFRVEAN
jgi:hypothetical protein